MFFPFYFLIDAHAVSWYILIITYDVSIASVLDKLIQKQ